MYLIVKSTHAVDFEGQKENWQWDHGAEHDPVIERFSDDQESNDQIGEEDCKEEAVEEADYVLEKIREHHVEYPIAFDMEDASDHDRIRDMTAEDCTRVAVAFARRIREAGYEPIIYGSASWLESRIFMEEIQDICGFWVASYNTSRLPMIHDYKIWQYSSQGEVPGIDGIVDLNIYMKKK